MDDLVSFILTWWLICFIGFIIIAPIVIGAVALRQAWRRLTGNTREV